MKIEIYVPTMKGKWGPSWEKLARLIESCVAEGEDDGVEVDLTRIARKDGRCDYRGDGSYEVTVRISDEGGTKAEHGALIRVEGTR